MDVLILAAGRGERLRPATDTVPKPLLEVAGTTLIAQQIRRLAAAGHRRMVVNLAHLGDRIRESLGNGGRLGVEITYSQEPPGALDTGGGIVQALSFLRGEVFAVVNADVWTDFPYHLLPAAPRGKAWLVLVDNPPQHPDGDFVLDHGRVREKTTSPGETLTFAGIGVYRRDLFDGLDAGRYPLLPILTGAIQQDGVDGMHYQGTWMDIGTPERLAALRERVGGSD